MNFAERFAIVKRQRSYDVEFDGDVVDEFTDEGCAIELIKYWSANLQAAYSAGAEQMRAAAVLEAIKFMEGPEFGFDGKTHWKVQEKIRDAIRNLPVGESSRAPEGSQP